MHWRSVRVLMNERLVDAVSGWREVGKGEDEKNGPLDGGTLVRGGTQERQQPAASRPSGVHVSVHTHGQLHES